MLIPWPGPQLTSCIYMAELPVCMDIQSSPVVRFFYLYKFHNATDYLNSIAGRILSSVTRVKFVVTSD